MIDQQNEFTKQITSYLDKGAAGIKEGTLYRLQQARAQALARLQVPTTAAEPFLAPALSGGGTRHGSAPGGIWKNTRLWLGIVIIVVASFGYQQWQLYQQTEELEELDTQLLSSDLPIDAYLDQGFQSWLTRSDP